MVILNKVYFSSNGFLKLVFIEAFSFSLEVKLCQGCLYVIIPEPQFPGRSDTPGISKIKMRDRKKIPTFLGSIGKENGLYSKKVIFY